MKISLRSLGLGLILLGACTERGATPDAAPVKQADDSKPVAPTPVDEQTLPDAEKLLADSVEAMGGAAKFAALKSFYSESTLNMGSLGLTGVAKIWWRAPGDFYNESEMPGVGQTKMGGAGGKVWADDPISGQRTLSGKEAEQGMWAATLCLACEWKQHFKSAKTTGVTEVEGKKLAEISLTSPLGDVVVMRIDLESKMPVSQSFTQVSPLGSMPVTVHFKDVREVEGLKIPFQQMVDASLTQAVSTTTKIEFNVPIDETKFVMPGGREQVTPGKLENPAKIEAPPVDPTKAGQPATPTKGEADKTGKPDKAGQK